MSLRILGLALLLGCGALWLPPASWLDRAMAQASQGRLRLAEAGGTLWRGGAQLMRLTPSPSRAARTLGRIEWRFRFAALRAGTAQWDLRQADASAALFWSPSGWRVEGLDDEDGNR